jgi:hypothetical protein
MLLCCDSPSSPSGFAGHAWPFGIARPRHAKPEGRSVVPLAGNRLFP